MSKSSNAFEKLLERPSSDWAFVIILTALALLFGIHRWIAVAPPDTQRAAYSATAGVLGTIAGFIVASTYFFAGLDNRKANELRRDRGPLINRTLVGAFLALALSAGVCVYSILASPPTPAPGVVLDPNTVGIRASVAFVIAGIVAFFKLLRISVLSWAMLASQYEEARTRPKPLRK